MSYINLTTPENAKKSVDDFTIHFQEVVARRDASQLEELSKNGKKILKALDKKAHLSSVKEYGIPLYKPAWLLQRERTKEITTEVFWSQVVQQLKEQDPKFGDIEREGCKSEAAKASPVPQETDAGVVPHNAHPIPDPVAVVRPETPAPADNVMPGLSNQPPLTTHDTESTPTSSSPPAGRESESVIATQKIPVRWEKPSAAEKPPSTKTASREAPAPTEITDHNTSTSGKPLESDKTAASSKPKPKPRKKSPTDADESTAADTKPQPVKTEGKVATKTTEQKDSEPETTQSPQKAKVRKSKVKPQEGHVVFEIPCEACAGASARCVEQMAPGAVVCFRCADRRQGCSFKTDGTGRKPGPRPPTKKESKRYKPFTGTEESVESDVTLLKRVVQSLQTDRDRQFEKIEKLQDWLKHVTRGMNEARQLAGLEPLDPPSDIGFIDSSEGPSSDEESAVKSVGTSREPQHQDVSDREVESESSEEEPDRLVGQKAKRKGQHTKPAKVKRARSSRA